MSWPEAIFKSVDTLSFAACAFACVWLVRSFLEHMDKNK